jgi:hypothetical protein
MARAYRGPYARPSSYPVPYATAAVWGTGIDPVHSFYGEGPPVRVIGRDGAAGFSPIGQTTTRDRSYQQPGSSSGANPPEEVTWGYPVDYGPDSFGQGADAPISTGDVSFGIEQYMDDRPWWGNDAPNQEIRANASTMAPWGSSGLAMLARRAGSHRFRRNRNERLVGQGDGYQPVSAEPSNSNPTETVSEGWLNKATSFTAYAHPSDPSQYEVQTSMRQRFGTRDNSRAQARSTDAARSKIASRVEPMVEKVYSTGERLYDMFPFQIDQIERPFRYRTAGVGPAEWLEPNAYSAVTPIQRVPPPDPAMGVPEVSEEYGYTQEDSMYYA